MPKESKLPLFTLSDKSKNIIINYITKAIPFLVSFVFKSEPS